LGASGGGSWGGAAPPDPPIRCTCSLAEPPNTDTLSLRSRCARVALSSQSHGEACGQAPEPLDSLGLCRRHNEGHNDTTTQHDTTKPTGFEPCPVEKPSSSTGTRTLVFRVRAEYPDQLDYRGACGSTSAIRSSHPPCSKWGLLRECVIDTAPPRWACVRERGCVRSLSKGFERDATHCLSRGECVTVTRTIRQ
jgi:hypothetical protein